MKPTKDQYALTLSGRQQLANALSAKGQGS
jgi:hypothetical protein